MQLRTASTSTDERGRDRHQPVRHRLAGAVVAAAVLSASTAVATATAAAAPPADAPCVPTALPVLAGTSGEVMWITNSGLAVGESATGVILDDGSPLLAATYWTHDNSGYHIHTLPGDPLVDDEVLDVNESGRMVDYGYDLTTGRFATAVYDLATNQWWRLPSLDGPDTRGRRINASGVVSGGGLDQTGHGYAATWTPPYTRLTRLPDVGQYPYAAGINDAGVTVGSTNQGRYTPALDPTIKNPGQHGYPPLTTPIEWAPNRQPSRLPTLFTQAEPFAINDAGTIVGSSDTPSFTIDAAYWTNGQVHDMGGRPDAFNEARGLSQGGWATGGSAFYAGGGQAFVWTGVGTLQYLHALAANDGNSNAHGVNDTVRQIGGWSEDDAGSIVPTIWQCPAGFTTG